MCKTIFLAVFSLIVLNLYGQSISTADADFNDDNVKKQIVWADKKLKKLKHARSIMPIDGGTFVVTSAMEADLWIDPNDTTLVLSDMPKRITVNPFYICNHEVTNHEYRTFVAWVIDSLSLAHPDEPMYCYYENDSCFFCRPIYNTDKIIYNNVKIYPDTLCWMHPYSSLGSSFSEPWTHHYFHHVAFADFPVVGVNWYQAIAYCTWKTARLIEEAKKKKMVVKAVFRLPTEAEWQYAASVRKEKIKDESQIVVQDSYLPLIDKKGNLRTNIARVVDKNGCVVYQNPHDFSSAHVFSYPQNYFKLYHMRGNVSEWMLDNNAAGASLSPTSDTTGHSYKEHIAHQLARFPRQSEKIEFVTNLLNAVNGEIKGIAISDDNLIYQTLMSERAILMQLRTEIICNRPDLRIVKGGSWEDGVIFQHSGSSEMIHAGMSRRCTGFRVAMSLPEQ